MSGQSSAVARAWDVLLVGGPSGCGKSTLSYPFAHRLDLALAEADDLFITAEVLTRAADLPDLHFFRSQPQATGTLPPEEIVEAFIRTSRVMTPAFEAVIANHLQTERPLLLEGDYLLPELLVRVADRDDGGRVRGVFLIEEDEARIVRNYQSREPGAGRQSKRARVSWLYGQWLEAECERLGLTALAARPWETLEERILAAID